MKELEASFQGAALAATFMVDTLINALVANGVLIEPTAKILESTLISMGKGQGECTDPDQAAVWKQGRAHVEALIQALTP